MENYVTNIQNQIDTILDKYDIAILENPTNIGKENIISNLVSKYGKTLLISQSYDINRQWNNYPDVIKNTVFMTYNMFSSIEPDDIYSFCSSYKLIIFDEAHHTGADGYISNVSRVIDDDNKSSKIFGITTHTKRYSDEAEDVAYTVFHGHKINGITFEDAIRQKLLPQFDYISALYSLPKDIDDLIASSSLARKIISDSKLVQINEDGIKTIIKKHMPDGNRKIVYFVPSIEDSNDAEKLSKELGYGQTYVINYTKSDSENRDSLKAYDDSPVASLICISKFNEGAIPKGTNTVVILRKTMTINVFERQVLTALCANSEKPIVYDFVANIDNLTYSTKNKNTDTKKYYTEKIKSLCSQSIIVDYARPWTSVFTKLRNLTQNEWTPVQDDILRKYYPKYGNEIYKYIKNHNLQECILRAELLGITYEETKEQNTDQKELQPFTLPFMNIVNTLSENSPFDKKFIKTFIRAYRDMLEEGRIPSEILKEINNLETIKTKNNDIVKHLETLADTCINATTINIDTNKQIIIKRQKNFKTNIIGYTKSCNQKTSNVIILDGKAITGDISQEDLKRLKKENKKDNMILVGDCFMNKKNTIAGLLGNTVMEHTLYKTYWRMIMNNYKTDNISQFIQEYSIDDVQQLISCVRNARQPWTAEEEYDIQHNNNHNEVYKKLIKTHSDLDILSKAETYEIKYFALYCKNRTELFEKNYQKFIQNYQQKLQEIEIKESRKQQQLQQEEEKRQKQQADKKRIKNLTPTVHIVSSKKRKKQNLKQTRTTQND